MAAMPAGAAVFKAGLFQVEVRHVKQRRDHELPKPVMVLAPSEAGSYPVLLFLHGFLVLGSCYQKLLTHVASHGFIAVAPQLYGIMFDVNDMKDIESTSQIINWIAGGGLAHVLKDIFRLKDVKPDLSKVALAGHSRGGDTAFSVAPGLGDAKTKLALKLSALIGIEPVAGASKDHQMEPKVLTFKPQSLDVGMPVMVLGTGKTCPCAPDHVNHAEFYDECKPPRYHLVVKDYGHLDMVDDHVLMIFHNLACQANSDDTNGLVRRTMRGAMVAFMRATMDHKDENLNAILADKQLAPATLEPVEHNP